MGLSVLKAKNRRIVALAACFGVLAGSGLPAAAARLKDIAAIKGVRDNQLIGYGLIVGLNGSGDKSGTEFTIQSLTSLLAKMGVAVDVGDIRVRNVAAVMVTGTLPPFARTGSRIDSLVSSLGDSTSLEGGTLLMTPLFGSDGEIYAIAQGPVSVGGFAAGGGGGSSVQKNHPTVGRVANGAIVEREISYGIEGKTHFEVALRSPDFTTALRMATSINRHFQMAVADPKDSGTLDLSVPPSHAGNVVRFLAEVESVEVEPDRVAKVILNERTGTVVMGATVTVATVAISHGSLSVSISATNQVSQPAPFSKGRTAIIQNQDVEVFEENGNLSVINHNTTVGDLVQGLNAMGVTPRDLIAILQAVKAAGALSADLELM